MTLATAIIILAACLLTEAFFSGAELALIAADRVGLRQCAEDQGGTRGELIHRFLADPAQLIATALTGTNICVVLSSVVATISLLPRFPHHAELMSFGIVTPLVLVFGEILPKSLFHHYADRLAPRLIWILSVFRLVFWPWVALGGKLSALVLRNVHSERRDTMTRDELRLLITLPSRPGEDRITQEEKRIISRIFDFRERAIEDVMVVLSEVTVLPDTASLQEVAAVIADLRHTRIPIYHERIDEIVGIVHAFDVLRAPRDTPVTSLARQPVFVPENQPAVDTLLRLQRHGQGLAVVVDEYGGAIGVAAIEDILEEVVGEIDDEFDQQELDLIRREPNGAFVVQARAPVEVLNSAAGLGLPIGEEYETVGGLVLDQLKFIPRVGRQLRVGPVLMTVTGATDRSVEEVRVEVVDGTPPK